MMNNEERRKATEWFRNRAKNCPMSGSRRMYEIATEALEEHERNEQPRWIPVTERLPEDGQKVLVLEPPYWESSRYYYSIVYFVTNLEKVDEYDFQGKNRSGFCSLDSEWGWCEHCKVLYWTPLPKVPEKESDN